MKLFIDFFKQQVPKSSGEVPLYYRQSIRINDQLLAVYFFLSFILISWSTKSFCLPPIAFLALLLLKYSNQKIISVAPQSVALTPCWSAPGPAGMWSASAGSSAGSIC